MAKYEKWLTEEGLIRIEGWARDGLTNLQIAKNVGVSMSTFADWIKKYPEISEALKKGKDVADRIVENALFMTATGFTKTAKKAIKVRSVIYDENTGRKIKETEEIVYQDEETYYPPNTTAQIFWLKNRKPAVWKTNPVDDGIDTSVTVKWEEESYAD